LTKPLLLLLIEKIILKKQGGSEVELVPLKFTDPMSMEESDVIVKLKPKSEWCQQTVKMN
jgi:cobalt-zinc-cadmium resistance protein CzcA